jgi:NADPH:quinone reductase-like Zn-dependent oxidoreductase
VIPEIDDALVGPLLADGVMMRSRQYRQYRQYGGPELMRLEEVEPASPGNGQVLVRVRAAAANPKDWKIRSGATRLVTGHRFPRGYGHGFAGTVVGVGEGVKRFKAGDDVLGVMGLKASGAFAEMAVADEKLIVEKPAGLSYEEAAVFPAVGVIALQPVIGKGRLRAGQGVFINGCLGGVGRAAAQIALMHGASVAGSCRGTAAADARALGIAPVVGALTELERTRTRTGQQARHSPAVNGSGSIPSVVFR